MKIVKNLLSFAVMASGLVYADCVDGFRKLTAAEASLHQTAVEAISAALPPAWEGWKTYGELPSVSKGARVCASTPVGAFDVSTVITYRYLNPPRRRSYPEEAEIKKLQDEMEALRSMPPDVRKRYNDVMAQQSEKRRASRAAEQAGNKEEATKLRKEADEIMKGTDKIRNDYLASISGQIQEREGKVRQLRAVVPDYHTEVRVAVTVNERTKVPPAGKGLNEEVYVWGSASPAKNGTTVQNVVLKVTGWPDYRETVTAKIDTGKLSAIAK